MSAVLCRKPNEEGELCARHKTPGEDHCWWHNPERVEERARKLEERAARIRLAVSQ